MAALPRYSAKDLLQNNAAKGEAANLLLGVLLTRDVMKGRSVGYWARLWGRTEAGLFWLFARTRSLLVVRKAGGKDLTNWIPDPMSLHELQRDRDTYEPMLDALEMEACLELEDARAEALIRQMFSDRPKAIFVLRDRETKKRAATPKRGPGRPKGAKNKPKVPQHDGDGWLMPDGSRLPT
jgi:hypothetical protein